jgi:hypothetical protein
MEIELLALEVLVRQARLPAPLSCPAAPNRDQDGTGPDLQVVAAGWLRRAVPSLIEDWAESVAGVVLGTAEGRGCCLLAYQRASTTVDAG